MVKIIVDMTSKEKSTIEVHGNSTEVIDNLANGVYQLLDQLKMKENLTDRFDLFHGAMLFNAMCAGKKVL